MTSVVEWIRFGASPALQWIEPGLRPPQADSCPLPTFVPEGSLGEVRFSNPQQGRWPFQGLPEEILVGGKRFQRTAWAWGYEGVVAQYREAAATNAMHLMVYRDGSWVIDHLDESNPDAGPLAAVKHFFIDTTPGKITGVVLLAVAAGYAVKSWSA